MILRKRQLSLSCDFLFFYFSSCQSSVLWRILARRSTIDVSPRQLIRGERRETWHLQKHDHNGRPWGLSWVRMEGTPGKRKRPRQLPWARYKLPELADILRKKWQQKEQSVCCRRHQKQGLERRRKASVRQEASEDVALQWDFFFFYL